MIDPMPELAIERRSARSSRPEVALSLFLEAARERLGVATLAVCDELGELVAGVGDAPGFVAGLGFKVDAGQCERADIATWRLSVGERSYVISSLGARLHEDLGAAVRRILS
jgi:hypothetical protein